MRKAEYIVACLLEAVAKGTTIRFGPGDDPYGEEFFSLEDALEGKTEDEMLQQGYSFMTEKNPGDIGVYSLKPQIGTMERGTELIAHIFSITPETKVNFSNKVGAPGTPIALKNMFRERPAYKKTGEPRENPIDAAGVASQPADEPEEEMVQPNPEHEKYIQSLQGQPPVASTSLDFGMEVDSAGQDGVLVSHVIAGGPAANADLQAGDRITFVHFETKEGSWGPYKIKTLNDFKNLRAYMQPGYNVGLRFIRGGHEHPTGIQPKPVQTAREQGQDMSMVNAQNDPLNRAWIAMEKDKADLPSLTVSELAQYHQIEPKQVVYILNNIGARARDYLPHEQQPNERDPASLTGNQPANPSALT